MSWLDKFRQASFRNVEFYVPAHEGSGGRRVAVHEFPGKNTPYIEDLGRSARRFEIEAYVIGENYNFQRDELLEAVEKAGSGKLVHPYLGTMQVVCIGYRVRESVGEGRMARFTISVVESGERLYPRPSIAPAEDVVQKKQNALTAIKAGFNSAYDISNKPYSVTQNVIGTINGALAYIQDSRAVVGNVSAFQRDMQNLQGTAISLAYSAVSLSENLVDSLNFGTDLGLEDYQLTADAARVQYDEQRKIWKNYDENPVTLVNDTDPSSMVIELIQQAAVVVACGLISVMSFGSWDEAREIEAVVFEKLQELAEATQDDDIYAALLDLRASVHRDFEERETTLPRLVIYTPPITTNSLALAYRLYGNIEKEQEIINRNKIKHPGFILGQRDLEVVLDVT